MLKSNFMCFEIKKNKITSDLKWDVAWTKLDLHSIIWKTNKPTAWLNIICIVNKKCKWLFYWQIQHLTLLDLRIKFYFKNNSGGQIINEHPLPLSLGSGGQERKYNNKNNCLPLCAISVKIKSMPVLWSGE